jgi:hypothetical protein
VTTVNPFEGLAEATALFLVVLTGASTLVVLCFVLAARSMLRAQRRRAEEDELAGW